MPPSPSRRRAATTALSATNGGTVRDEDGICLLIVPSTYKVDSAGDGFDALDDNGFGVLTGVVGRNESPEALAQLLYGNFTAVFTGAQPSPPDSKGDTSRIDFIGALGSRQGKGTTYIKKFGTTVCGVSLFTYDNAAVAHTAATSAILTTIERLP